MFYAMFYGGLAENKKEIEVPDVEPAAFLALLRYIGFMTDQSKGRLDDERLNKMLIDMLQVYVLRRCEARSRHGAGNIVRREKVHRAALSTCLCYFFRDKSERQKCVSTAEPIETVRRARPDATLLGGY